MEIYIDVFFIINFIADFLLLILCDLNVKKILRKGFAAAIGSLYACLFLFNLPKIFYSPIAKLIVAVIICYIAFSPCRIKIFFEKCTVFLFVSMLFCGIMYAAPLLLDTKDIPWIISAITAFFIIRLSYVKIKNKLYSNNCKIKIMYNNRSVTVDAMIDTGNTLKDPITGVPALVIDEKILKTLFSPSAKQNNLCEFVEPEDFRIIPYKTISNSGIAYGFVPDMLSIDGKAIKNTIIAVAPSPINTDALISPQLI